MLRTKSCVRTADQGSRMQWRIREPGSTVQFQEERTRCHWGWCQLNTYSRCGSVERDSYAGRSLNNSFPWQYREVPTVSGVDPELQRGTWDVEWKRGGESAGASPEKGSPAEHLWNVGGNRQVLRHFTPLSVQKLGIFYKLFTQNCVQQTCSFSYSFYTSVSRHILNFYNHFVCFTVSKLPLSFTIPLNPQQEYRSLINSKFFKV